VTPTRPRAALVSLAVVAGTLVAGCGSPNRINIGLRKDIQTRDAKIAQLQRQHDVDAATIAGLTSRSGAAAVASLSPDRLDRLFTVYGIKLARLSGGADLDPSRPGDEGLKLYVGLIDQTGDEFKSAGSFVVEAFDLSAGQANGLRVGRWEFPVEKSRETWHSFMMRYEYVLTCPWQDVVPRHPELTVKVVFNDELTGRQFTLQQSVKINPPPANEPTASPPPSPSTRPGTQPAADSR
jgi:outer membrane murein-binding lipoprotein Lpp